MLKISIGFLLCFICLNRSDSTSLTTPFHMLDAQQHTALRPLLIEVYTPNCGYCQMQEKILEKDTVVRNLIRQYYYFSALNAYNQDTLIYNGRAYPPTQHGGSIHPLVAVLAGNTDLAYPFWIIITPNGRAVFRHKGLLSAKTLRSILGLHHKF